MGDITGRFFVLDVILLFVFIGLISMVFSLSRISFVGVLAILIVLMFFAFISVMGVYRNRNWGFILLSSVFVAILIGLMIVYSIRSTISSRFVTIAILSALGFVIAVSGIKKKAVRKEEVEKVYTNFEPGKYVASKVGNTYHRPRCEWATKIKPKNRIWFQDEKEAKKKFKPHSCI